MQTRSSSTTRWKRYWPMSHPSPLVDGPPPRRRHRLRRAFQGFVQQSFQFLTRGETGPSRSRAGLDSLCHPNAVPHVFRGIGEFAAPHPALHFALVIQEGQIHGHILAQCQTLSRCADRGVLTDGQIADLVEDQDCGTQVIPESVALSGRRDDFCGRVTRALPFADVFSRRWRSHRTTQGSEGRMPSGIGAAKVGRG